MAYARQCSTAYSNRIGPNKSEKYKHCVWLWGSNNSGHCQSTTRITSPQLTQSRVVYNAAYSNGTGPEES